MAVPLERVQRWMQEVVVNPSPVGAAIEAPGAQAQVPAAEVAQVILPSRTLGPAERVGIYQRMYLLRMMEALETDYPGLRHFLGHERFRDLVRGYVQEHPSRSFSLNRLGDHLPDYVQGARGVRRRDFCHDLARLERAVSQVFDEEETAPLSEAEIAVVPAEAWEGARLRPVAAFRLLGFRYPVNAYLDSTRGESHDHPPARRQDTWAVVYRRDYTVWRLDFSKAAHDLLAALAAGAPLGAAVAATQRPGGRRVGEDEIFRWFRSWIANGLFRGLAID